ncbi:MULTISPECIES: helix-turn-helix domain-containing protein [Oscillospiraceae]|uniref:helix-turn-helix domain-containing protein n=1 Tax=Oscillospiraceae TaxID=216572 RepID=UPI0026573F3A|nr:MULTISPECIES: helix-turn-helix domain-containing protein [unclassified Oscillibacter]
MLSIPQVASVLSISRAGAYELAHSKNFPSILIGSRIVVPKDRLLAWVDSKVSERV